MAETVSNAGMTPNASSPLREDHRRKEHHWWIWIAVILLLVLGIGLLAILRRQKPKAPPPRPISITETNVQTGDIQVAVTALGSVTPCPSLMSVPRPAMFVAIVIARGWPAPATISASR